VSVQLDWYIIFPNTLCKERELISVTHRQYFNVVEQQ